MTAPQDHGDVSIDPDALDLDDGGRDAAAYAPKPQDEGEPASAEPNEQEGGEG